MSTTISRREVLSAMGSSVAAGLVNNVWPARLSRRPQIRWGIVGTGSIANSMAGVIASVPSAELAAVSSRRMASAERFAGMHGASQAFDDWAAMAAWDGIDAVYIATPTSVRETIAIAAADAGRHVLAEKPFASLPSLQRIVDVCRARDVGFMDANHFGHHPRTAAIRAAMADQIGRPTSLISAYQFPLDDRGNIRFDPSLEPMGAVGDVGWYCMRAIAEYLPRDLAVQSAATRLRRDPETGAAVQGAGVLQFDDATTSTWNASYISGAVFTDLRITGSKGVITLDDFPANNPDGSADYLLHRGDFEATQSEPIRIESPFTSRQLMFEDFAAMTADAALRERSIADSLRTQALLDQVWAAGIADESVAVAPR